MDAHGVDVFYGADHDDVIGEVAHDLELELLPAGDALFDEGRPYGARVEAVDDGAAELAVVAGGGASLAAESEAGADYEGDSLSPGPGPRLRRGLRTVRLAGTFRPMRCMASEKSWRSSALRIEAMEAPRSSTS